MFAKIKSFFVSLFAAIAAVFHRDIDSIVGTLDKTVAQLDKVTARERAKRIASLDREFTYQQLARAELDMRSASYEVSDRANRVRTRISNIIA